MERGLKAAGKSYAVLENADGMVIVDGMAGVSPPRFRADNQPGARARHFRRQKPVHAEEHGRYSSIGRRDIC